MVKEIRQSCLKALGMFLIFTLLCGVLYTGVVTLLAQTLFPAQAGGSIVEVDGKRYSTLLGQQYTDDAHLWGRVTELEVTPFTDKDGKPLLYAAPSNLAPDTDEYAALVAQRVARIRAANPEMQDIPIPVDLVTGSGSGLDPGISPAAADYQVARIARASGHSEADVRRIIDTCTTGRFLGVFGEKTVNVLRVNLMLDGVLK